MTTKDDKQKIEKRASLFDNLATLDEFIEMTRHNYSRVTIYRWIRSKGMPHRKIHGKLWIPIKEAELWLQRSS